MLNELREIFQSNIKSLEMLYLMEDIKPAARIMLREEEKDKIFDFFKEKGINYSLSDFKVIKQDKEKGYSDKGIKVPVDSSQKGYFLAYLSKKKELAKKAKELENNNKHKELGILLGYPECCSGFFERHFEEQSRRNNDFTLSTLKDSDGFSFPFYTNIAARHFDLALLNHFPCSFSCKHSIELAKRHLEVIEKHDKEAADIIKGMLKGAVVYTETNGVFLLRYPELEHNRLYYKGVMGSRNSQLYGALKNAEYVNILQKNRIMLDNLEIKNIGVMLFS
ncbi:hypothetical protein KY366_08040 [Candidatus Woesearchaeota archaeon]|nr:hypothetical protein [Candidatus Woesearchaeota archaeon]